MGRLLACARRSTRDASVVARGDLSVLPAGLYRDTHWLVYRRGGAATLGGLWSAAHGTSCHALSRPARRCFNTADIRRNLLPYFFRWHPLHLPLATARAIAYARQSRTRESEAATGGGWS